MEASFETFTWMEQTRYKCPDCGFDASREIDVVKHWNSTHNDAQPTMGPGPLLFDADGKELDTRTIYVDGIPNFSSRATRGADDSEEF